ncbi:hypothetical protein AK966_12435 [Vibrio sp. PID23_8]|jgi:diguanylate cyclase|nr:hypothetical protein AK965_03300 [Vibrio sp. PID17_43]RIZ53508.1 hypothetical protein AK966_12435 [Vibrio sp. PID23_8]
MIEKLRVTDKRSGTQVQSITASFGVAEYQIVDTLESLINKADKQFYEAKQLSRNRVMPV